MFNLTATISLLELAWSGAFLVAFLFNVWNLKDALIDLRVQRASTTAAIILALASQRRWRQTLRCCISAALCIVGGIQMTVLPREIDPDPRWAESTISTILFMAVAFLLAFESVKDRLNRIDLLHAFALQDGPVPGVIVQVAQETAEKAQDTATSAKKTADTLRDVVVERPPHGDRPS